MVRRRTRPPKTTLEEPSKFASTGNGVAANGGCPLEDQYFASPKRKDCKIDNETGVGVNEGDEEHLAANKSKPVDKAKGVISGRTIGVPLATRSQTRTIENFFKANTAAKNSKLNLIAEEKKTITISASADMSSPQITNFNDDHDTVNAASHHQNETSPKQPDFIFDLSEDTNDSDDTEFSDEANAGAHAIDFCTHRAPLRDSHSSRSSTTDNIFLQEPVLTLNVDKTLNQASSIKINKSIKVEPIFSSPPSLSAVALNGRFHQIVSLNGSSSFKHDLFGFESKPVAVEMNGAFSAVDANLLPDKDNDNSSCDSGVAFTSSTDNNNSPPLAHAHACVEEAIMIVRNTCDVVGNNSQTRRRKPATPHRIVCPSPMKSAARVVSPVDGTISPSARKAAASKDQLSPRKSPRHVATAASSKTRRRLNTQKEQQTPYRQIGTSEGEDNAMQSSCKQNGYIDHDTAAIDLDQDFEDVEDIKFSGISSTNSGLTAANNITSKSILSAKHPTAHDNSTNYNNHIQMAKSQPTKTPKSSSINTKAQQPKTNQPLAATNGNRQLTEFFPVRRSVRKTKSAVHREAMQNLQQCVLEGRAEGLKVAYFEGKGRGIIADRHFHRNEFVVEYVGDLISVTEASEREKRYTLDENAGCYMYYFKHQNRQYCIDATADTGKLGRLVNHSRKGNLTTNVILVRNRPHLILLANQDIKPGEELTYDYGDRSKLSLQHHPWLAS